MQILTLYFMEMSSLKCGQQLFLSLNSSKGALTENSWCFSSFLQFLCTLWIVPLNNICSSSDASEGHSVVSDSLWPYGLYTPWNSPGQNTGVGILSLLQWIFPTQESNQGLLHCRWILYQLSYQESPVVLITLFQCQCHLCPVFWFWLVSLYTHWHYDCCFVQPVFLLDSPTGLTNLIFQTSYVASKGLPRWLSSKESVCQAGGAG